MIGGRKLLWLAIPVALVLSGNGLGWARNRGALPQPGQKDKDSKSKEKDAAQTSKEEEKAIKNFRNVSASDLDKKTQLGEEFITSYPQSKYRPEVVTWLAKAYASKGQVDKLAAEGDKELALTPNNPISLAALGSNLARTLNGNTSELQKLMDQAETLCRKSLEAVDSAKKPDNLSDEKFTDAKNQTSSLAYSGLGTLAFRNGKYTEAISDMDKSIKLGGGSDPVNYYLLGKANEAATNYSEALAAYTKCAAIPGAMQSPCQSSIADVKAHGAVLPK